MSWSRWLAAICCASVAVSQPVMAVDGRGAVKAAIVLNIIRFIDFPGDPNALKLCVRQTDPVAPYFDRASGRRLGTTTITVETVASRESFSKTCDIIYLDRESPSGVAGQGSGQVLIGASNRFIERGGTIGLISFGGQVRFEINNRQATRSGFRVEAQLLQLAARVIP